MALPARRAEELPRKERAPRRPAVVRSLRRRPARRARRAPFILFSGLLVAGMLILLASAQAIVAQGVFRLSDLSDRAERLEVETDLFRLRMAQLSTPDKIAEAGRRAGLRLPAQVEVLGQGPS